MDDAGTTAAGPRFLARRFVAFIYNLALVALLLPILLLAVALLAWGLVSLLDIHPKELRTAVVILWAAALLLLLAWRTSGGRRSEGLKSAGLAVKTLEGGDPAFGQAVQRALLQVVALLPLGSGFWWAAIDEQGRTWPDLVMETRVVEADGLEAPLPWRIVAVHALDLIAMLASGFAVLNLMPVFSFTNEMLSALLVALFAALLAIALGFGARIGLRALPRLARLARNGSTIALLVLVFLFIFGGTIPSNSYVRGLVAEEEAERTLRETGALAERFAGRKGRVAESWQELIDAGYLSAPPRPRSLEYLYRAEQVDGRRRFVIEEPQPRALYRGRGFLPGQRCKAVKYVQQRGVVVETE